MARESDYGGFEYSVPITDALPANGSDTLISPYDTACEWSIISCSFGGQGALAIGVDSTPPTPGPAFQTNSGGWRGFTINSPGAGNPPVADTWMSCPNGRLYLATGAGTNTVQLVVAFRRRLDSVPIMPDIPHVDPADAAQVHVQRAVAAGAALAGHGDQAYIDATLFGRRPQNDQGGQR